MAFVNWLWYVFLFEHLSFSVYVWLFLKKKLYIYVSLGAKFSPIRIENPN